MLSDTKLFTPELGGGGGGEFSLQTPDLTQAFSFSHELGVGGGGGGCSFSPHIPALSQAFSFLLMNGGGGGCNFAHRHQVCHRLSLFSS